MVHSCQTVSRVVHAIEPLWQPDYITVPSSTKWEPVTHINGYMNQTAIFKPSGMRKQVRYPVGCTMSPISFTISVEIWGQCLRNGSESLTQPRSVERVDGILTTT